MTLRLRLCQRALPKAPLDALEREVESADAADLTLFPELFLSGYEESRVRAFEGVKGEALAALGRLSRRADGTVVCGAPADGHNAALVVRGEETRLYAKRRLFAPLNERALFSPGTGGLTFDVGLKCGVLICYDLRFPELARDYCVGGVTLLTVIAAWPAARVSAFRTLLRARALENQVFVAGCNLTGEAGGVRFGGGSAVFAPDGTTLGTCGEEEGDLVCEANTGDIARSRALFDVLGDLKSSSSG